MHHIQRLSGTAIQFRYVTHITPSCSQTLDFLAFPGKRRVWGVSLDPYEPKKPIIQILDLCPREKWTDAVRVEQVRLQTQELSSETRLKAHKAQNYATDNL